MKIKVFFIKNSHNFYSLATLLSAVENLQNIYPEIIPYAFLIDLNIKNLPYDKIIFCFSYNTISFYSEYDELKKTIKNYKSDKTYFLAGGPHPSAKPEELLNMGFNTVIIGEGEQAIIDYLQMLKNNINPPRILRKQVSELDYFPSFPCKSFTYKPIEISRGCPYGCYFCQTTYLFSKKMKHRSIENIKSHVTNAFERGIKDFRFITPNALGYESHGNKPNTKAIKTLLSSIRDIIKDKGRIFFGTFPSEVRPEFLNEEVLKILKDHVDNKRIHIGLQSGSESMLKKSHRGHTVSDVEKAIEVCIKTGFEIDIDIILGMPNETQVDMERTMDFIKKYASEKLSFHVHYFIPLPGTPWSDYPPTPLPEQFKKELEVLVGKGRLWGAWKRQMEYFKLIETKKTFNINELDLKLTSC
ncbi:MAG: TIGR04013 family B12-binding domain/radical SAM domain-containing protein [Proteobacteria bacterium]|nr:TIGR04013 family B12-binding domain/radical SAM domain-containing protein [Pseudomonadota bacterium]